MCKNQYVSNFRTFCSGIFTALLLLISQTVTANTNNPNLLRISSANSVIGTDVLQTIIEKFKVIQPDAQFKIANGGARTVVEHGRQGKADLIITHYPPDEERFVAQGFGILHTHLMFNEYIILGPPDDPEGVGQHTSIVDVIQMLSENSVDFTAPSRKSGIYRKLEELVTMSGRQPNWPGYLQSNISGASNLRRSAELGVYTIADMGTYIAERENIGNKIVPLFRDSSSLRNYISVIVVNQKIVPNVNAKLAKDFYNFLISEEIQSYIGNYGKEKFGIFLYTPAAYSDPRIRAQRAEKLMQLASDRSQMTQIVSILLAFLLISSIIVTMWLRHKEKARRLATHANTVKSDFLANMSHELRTPLNAIIGYSEMLEEEAEDRNLDLFVKDLGKIKGAGKHLLSLINDILDLSKIESGKIDFYNEQIDVDLMLQEISHILQPLIEKNNNVFKIDINNGVESIFADITRLKQILFNLSSNAAKFTKDGTIKLGVKPQKDSLIFTVTDTGLGMTDEQLSRIFSPFEQASSSTTKEFGGTGLGLSITKQLCELMEGSIKVESKPGKGTKVIVTLPLNSQ